MSDGVDPRPGWAEFGLTWDEVLDPGDVPEPHWSLPVDADTGLPVVWNLWSEDQRRSYLVQVGMSTPPGWTPPTSRPVTD